MAEDWNAELAALDDSELTDIWLATVDPENPTAKERAALDLMEQRQVDF